MKIALTGGIACGKSLFAEYLNQLGVETIDADDIVHSLEAPNGEAVPLIVKEFGTNVLGADGGIDRKTLAKIVFTPADGTVDTVSQREKLESILFPLVREKIDIFFKVPPPSASGPIKVAIIPLLFESHWEKDYDIIVSLISPQDVTIQRMMENRGYTRQEALARISAQIPVSEKSDRSHYTVLNDSTPENLFAEAKKLVDWLIERSSYGRQ